jgi:DNA-binding MarR family transcriptional regulator
MNASQILKLTEEAQALIQSLQGSLSDGDAESIDDAMFAAGWAERKLRRVISELNRLVALES